MDLSLGKIHHNFWVVRGLQTLRLTIKVNKSHNRFYFADQHNNCLYFVVNPVPIGGQSLSGNLSAMSTPSRNEYLLQSRQPNTLSDPGSFPALSRLGNQLGGQLRNDEDMSINPNDDFPALPGAQSKSDQAVGGALGILGSGGSVFGKDLNIASASENPSNAAVGFAGPSSAFFPPGGNAGLAPLGTGASLLERGNKPGGLGLLGSNALQDGGSSGSLGSSLLGGQTSQSSGLLANLGLAQSSTSSSTTALSKESKYGLGGLLDIIRSNDRVSQRTCFCYPSE